MTIITVTDPELQIRGGGGGGGAQTPRKKGGGGGGGGGGGHTAPEKSGGGVSKKIFRASIWSKNKRKPEPPWLLPWIRHRITLMKLE